MMMDVEALGLLKGTLSERLDWVRKIDKSSSRLQMHIHILPTESRWGRGLEDLGAALSEDEQTGGRIEINT